MASHHHFIFVFFWGAFNFLHDLDITPAKQHRVVLQQFCKINYPLLYKAFSHKLLLHCKLNQNCCFEVIICISTAELSSSTENLVLQFGIFHLQIISNDIYGWTTFYYSRNIEPAPLLGNPSCWLDLETFEKRITHMCVLLCLFSKNQTIVFQITVNYRSTALYIPVEWPQ